MTVEDLPIQTSLSPSLVFSSITLQHYMTGSLKAWMKATHRRWWPDLRNEIIIIIMYLYSAQYLHILQDSKCYLTNPTAQVQPKSQVTCIPLTERQGLKGNHLSTTLRFFSLPLGIGPNDRGPPF